MMMMQSDEVMSGLRKSVRNISSPKKIIRFSDYRILTAAAAVTAIVIVFTSIINSSDKQEKQIAQLTTAPAPQEPKKDEKPAAATEEKTKTTLETASTLSANAKQSEGNKEKVNGTYNWSSPSKIVENNAAVTNSNVDKQAETAAAK